jgi:CheY-like chemotaxis protein
VNDVLDLTRAEAGQLTIYRDWTDIPPEIEDAVSEIRPLLAKKKLELVLEMPGSLPRVYCDRLRIRQVVLNLVGNAARYTDHGGIHIKVSADDHYVTFHISDTGPGIQIDDLELIFEPFARGRNRPTGETSGSGLGLSICRQFVELHNGQIWVNSELDKGSDFAFKIPIYPQESPQSNPARWISQEKIWRDRKPRLTVDASPTLERVMIFDPTGLLPMLLHHRSNEIDFVNVSNLDEVVLQSKHNPVSAVIVNGRTPELAVQIVEQCRSRLFDTPVIGCIFPSYLEKLKESGITAYLTKPIGLEELQQAIQQTHRPIRRILIIDDDNDLRKLMLRMLTTDAHFQVYTASSGEEALKIMPAVNPDLILLDIVLGDMSGWDLLKAKNSSPGLRDISVIILSGQDPQFEQLTTPVMLSTFGNGLPVDKLLESALGFSSIMFKTE